MVIKQLTPGNSISGLDLKYLKRIPVEKLVKLSNGVHSSNLVTVTCQVSLNNYKLILDYWNYIYINN